MSTRKSRLGLGGARTAFRLLAASVIAMLISTVAFVAPSSATTLPKVIEWTVSPTKLPQAGGSITIDALVDFATTCRLFSAPATIPGLPQTQDCSGGEATATVTVPANKTNQTHVYWIYLSATGAGTVAPGPIKVTVAGIPVPSLKSFTVTPNSLPPSGGHVTLAVTISAASTCTFSAKPAVPGLPVTLPCSGGSATVTVTVPANHTTLPISYFFYIHPVGVGWPRPTPFPLGVVVNVPPPPGYWLLGSDGGIFSFGAAQFYGSTGNIKLNKPVVGMAPTPDGHGYWLVASDGGVFTFGDAHFYGSMGAHPLNKPVVDMAVTPDGHGYWLVASDGGVFTFGDAHFYGSVAGQPLLKPIVGMAVDPTTGGYWLIAANGGVFTFNAAYYPNSGGLSDVVGITPTVSGNGYWSLESNGAVHWYGAAGNFGSALGTKSAAVGLASADGSNGYDIALADGTVDPEGGASFLGDMSNAPLNAPIISIATPTP